MPIILPFAFFFFLGEKSHLHNYLGLPLSAVRIREALPVHAEQRRVSTELRIKDIVLADVRADHEAFVVYLQRRILQNTHNKTEPLIKAGFTGGGKEKKINK